LSSSVIARQSIRSEIHLGEKSCARLSWRWSGSGIVWSAAGLPCVWQVADQSRARADTGSILTTFFEGEGM
jgi:hypothetical protein